MRAFLCLTRNNILPLRSFGRSHIIIFKGKRRTIVNNNSMSSTHAATAHTVHVVPENTGLLKVKQTEEAAQKASQLLQQDMESHNVYFNDRHFHNHIAHQILSLYGTGAPAAALQAGYDHNKTYQRPTLPTHGNVVADLREKGWAAAAGRYLGNGEHYPDFLRFFQDEITAKGWQAVLAEYVFARTPAADDMLVRLYAGIVHPIIQLMYGIEWAQPAIVAEALAQAAVHTTKLQDYLLGAERAAAELQRREDGEKLQSSSIMALYEAIARDDRLSQAANIAHLMGDGDSGVEAVLGRAWDEMIRVASRVRVPPEAVDEKTAEMFDAIMYVTASVATHPKNPKKHPKFDFFLIHLCNLSPIFLSINAQPWISKEDKARILEWKIRIDLLEYTARGCPKFEPGRIAAYKPEHPEGKTSFDVISRLYNYLDDGHSIKLGRAALICENLSKQYEDKKWLKLKGHDLWMKLDNMIIDCVQAPGPRWVFSAGISSSWDVFPDMEEGSENSRKL